MALLASYCDISVIWTSHGQPTVQHRVIKPPVTGTCLRAQVNFDQHQGITGITGYGRSFPGHAACSHRWLNVLKKKPTMIIIISTMFAARIAHLYTWVQRRGGRPPGTRREIPASRAAGRHRRSDLGLSVCKVCKEQAPREGTVVARQGEVWRDEHAVDVNEISPLKLTAARWVVIFS